MREFTAGVQSLNYMSAVSSLLFLIIRQNIIYFIKGMGHFWLPMTFLPLLRVAIWMRQVQMIGDE